MTFATVPLTSGESSMPRVFGARPFHTDGDLLALAFAPDGTLWSVEEPGLLRHWNVAKRQQLAYHSLDELATLWAFSPTASLVAAGSDELSVWEVRSGQIKASWPMPSWVTAIAFPHASGLLATGHDDSVIRVWDLASEKLLHELRGHHHPVSALAFSPDGSLLATAGEDRLIHIWDTGRGTRVRSLAGHTDRIPALAWRPDGRQIVSAGWDTTARVWDVATGEPVILLNSHAGQVSPIAFGPDGKRLACADSGNAIHVWDADSYKTLFVLREHTSEVRCLAFSPDGHLLASGGLERVIHIWDAEVGAQEGSQVDPLESRTCIAVSSDGRRVASLGAGTTLRVWDTATAEPVLDLEGNPLLRAFAASPDSKWLAGSVAAENGQELATSSRTTLRLWCAASGRRQALLEGQAGPITALTFAPDARLLAVAGFRSSDVWLWQVPQGEPCLILTDAVEGASVEALAFHPSGRLLAVGGIDYLATGGHDGLVAIWDIIDRKCIATLPVGTTAVSFTPGGTRLAVATLRQKLVLWDRENGEIITDLIGHLDTVTCLACSPYGRLLASGSDDRTVRLWDFDTGQARGTIELDTQIKALAFAPNGRHLFTGNGNTSCYQIDVREVIDKGE